MRRECLASVRHLEPSDEDGIHRVLKPRLDIQHVLYYVYV